MSTSNILGLDGQPFKSSDGKRFAIVGTINVHATVFELGEGQHMQDAIRIQQKMVKDRDPKLPKITQSMVFFWAEDDDTRTNNRVALLQQVQAFVLSMKEDGTTVAPKDSFELTDEMMGRVSEKGNGDDSSVG